MPIGYVVTVALMAGAVLCALAPPRRPRAVASVAFYCGSVVNEVPCVAIYWLLASTLLAVAQGDLGSGVGLLTVCLVVVVLGPAIAVIARRAMRSGAIVDRALDEGLGPRWRASLDAETAAGLRSGFSVGPILLKPAFARRRDVERVPDVAYGDAGVENRLDVYRHRSRPTGCPVLIHLHGGRLVRGTKNREGLPLIYELAARGWVCISANYRLSPAVTFPDHLVDVKKVIAWARAEGARYGADPDSMCIAGASAGAQLAALAALTPNQPHYQPGFEAVDTSVLAAVCLYGIYGWPGEQSDAFPLAHVSADAPPFFVSHGDLDTVLPVEGARDFVAKLRSVSRQPVVYAELPGAQHNFDMHHSVRCDNVVNAIESFSAWVRSHPQPAGG